jgi:uncharacterized membrane protein
MNDNQTTASKSNGWDDEHNWKLGIFYYNPKDKRLMPPKRNRFFGWTVNFANPLSILTMALLITAIVGVHFLIRQNFNR